jgi:hypothetical protein
METENRGNDPPAENPNGIWHAGVQQERGGRKGARVEAERVAKNGGKKGKQRRGARPKDGDKKQQLDHPTGGNAAR